MYVYVDFDGNIVRSENNPCPFMNEDPFLLVSYVHA